MLSALKTTIIETSTLKSFSVSLRIRLCRVTDLDLKLVRNSCTIYQCCLPPVFISVCRFFQETLPTTKEWEHTQIEQLGTFDPHVNAHGEKLVSLNIERILYWLAQVSRALI